VLPSLGLCRICSVVTAVALFTLQHSQRLLNCLATSFALSAGMLACTQDETACLVSHVIVLGHTGHTFAHSPVLHLVLFLPVTCNQLCRRQVLARPRYCAAAGQLLYL
jgi:hypothetical protein